jgi:tetratricopeptide (TPR) repeat protein
MNKISNMIIALSSLLIVACSGGQAENAEEALRHQRMAQTYQQQGQFRAAMLEARNAVQLQPGDASGYVVLAQIYNQVGAFASTQNLLENVVEDLPEVSTELAEAYLATKKFRSALNVLNSSSSSDAEQQRRLIMQARAHIALGDQNALAETIQTLQKIEGSATEVEYLRASAELAQGRREEAQTILQAVVAQSPEHVKSLLLLGELSLHANQLAQAEGHLTRALALTPNGDVMTVERAAILGHLTQTLIQQGRTSEAYTYQKLLADANPESQVVQQKFSDAMELYQQGKFPEAEVLLKEIHEQFPNDKNTGTLLGLVQLQQGDDTEALDLFDQFLDPETASSSLIQAAAVAKFRNNKIDEAVALLKAAAENQPNDASILATYGLALLDQNETSNEGALAIEKSLALNPQQQRLRIALAKRHIAMEKPEQAIAQLQKAYEEQPLDLMIQQSYFKALLNNEQGEEVLREIKEFQNSYPQNPRGAFMEGWYKTQVKDYKGAQAAFEKSLSNKNNPEKAMAYSGLAQVYELDNQLVKAATTWQTALQENPTIVAGYSRWLNLMQKLNKLDDAASFLTKLESSSNAWQPSVVLAQLLFNKRETEQAIKHIDIALTRSNNADLVKQIAANLYNQRGLELRSQQKIPEARVSLLKALEFYPDNINYLASLIDTELNANNIAQAQQLLDQFPQTEDNAAAHLFLQGAIFRVDNKPEAALKHYRQSWDAKPTDNAAEAIYTFHQRAENEQEANQLLDQWVEKLPQSSRPVLIKAINAQQKNDVSDAIKWYEKAIELAPGNATALNNLAWIYYEQKDPRALEFAKRAYDLVPGSPPILDTYGWILVEKGQVAEGIKYLEQAARLAPTATDIRDHLREAKARAN